MDIKDLEVLPEKINNLLIRYRLKKADLEDIIFDEKTGDKKRIEARTEYNTLVKVISDIKNLSYLI